MKYVVINKQTEAIEGVGIKPSHNSYIISVDGDFNLTKEITRINPLIPQVKKRGIDGRYLYKDNVRISTVTGEEEYDQVHYPDGKKPIRFETRVVSETVMKTDRGQLKELTYSREIEVPVEWEELEHVMIDNYETITVDIEKYPEYFTLQEVMIEKYRQYLLNDPLCDTLIGDYFFKEEDIDFYFSDKLALSFGSVSLDEGGYVSTQPIKLANSTSRFRILDLDSMDVGNIEVYINDVKLTSNTVILEEPTDTVVIKVVNIAKHPNSLDGYVIGY